MWIIWALLAAVFEAFAVLFRKQATGDQVNYRLIPILSIVFSLPLTTALALYFLVSQHQEVTAGFLLLLAANIIINSCALWARYRAIKVGEISRIEPLVLLVPALLLLVSWIVLREAPPVLGIVGVLCVTIGAIIINISAQSLGLFDPIRALLSNPANRYMLITIVLWTLATALDKAATRTISPVVYVWWLHIGIVVTLVLAYRPRRRDLRALIASRGWYIAGAGITGSVAFIFQMAAIQTVFVTYAIAVRRLDIILIIFLGHHVLKEGDSRARLAGAAFMILGIVLLT